MASEIAECGAIARRQLTANEASTARLAADLRARKPSFAVTIARGSSDHAALYLKHLIELKVGLACASLGPSLASLYHAPLRLAGAVAIAISQSGRSPDIVAMQRAAKDERAVTIALVNDEESPLARGADALLPLHAGVERSVAATKSMIASLAAAPVSRPTGARTASFWPRSPGCLRPSTCRRRAPLGGGGRDSGQGSFPVRRRPRRDPRCRRRSGAEAQGNVGDSRRGVFLPPKCCTGLPGSSGRNFRCSPSRPPTPPARGFFDALDRLASFGAEPLLVDCEAHPRWQTVVALDGGHPLLTPIVALHAFYRVAEATARRRGRDPDQPPPEESHRDNVSPGLPSGEKEIGNYFLTPQAPNADRQS